MYIILMAQKYVERNNIRLIYDTSRIGKYGYNQIYDFLFRDQIYMILSILFTFSR